MLEGKYFCFQIFPRISPQSSLGTEKVEKCEPEVTGNYLKNMAFTIQSLLKTEGKRRRTESPCSDPGFPASPPPDATEIRLKREEGSIGSEGKRPQKSENPSEVAESDATRIDPESVKKLSSLQLGYHLFRGNNIDMYVRVCAL